MESSVSPHGHEGKNESRTKWDEECWSLLRSQWDDNWKMSARLHNMEVFGDLSVRGFDGSQQQKPDWRTLRRAGEVRECRHWTWLVCKKSGSEGEERDGGRAWERRDIPSTELPETVGGDGVQSMHEGNGSGEAAPPMTRGKRDRSCGRVWAGEDRLVPSAGSHILWEGGAAAMCWALRGRLRVQRLRGNLKKRLQNVGKQVWREKHGWAWGQRWVHLQSSMADLQGTEELAEWHSSRAQPPQLQVPRGRMVGVLQVWGFC